MKAPVWNVLKRTDAVGRERSDLIEPLQKKRRLIWMFTLQQHDT